jgi:hypothetical protein
MIKAMRVGQTVVCTIGGKMFSKTMDTDADLIAAYEQALNTDENDKEELDALIKLFEADLTEAEQEEKAEFEEKKAELQQHKDLEQWMRDINEFDNEYFEVRDLKLYMKGIGITIPQFLAVEFELRKNNKEDLQALMNFWRLCALNPDPRCREDLYKFLINNSMVVTPSGYFLAYRNANVKKEGNRELNEFVGAQVIKIKNWKKSTRNYVVLENTLDNGEPKYISKHINVLDKWLGRNHIDGYNRLGTMEELSMKMQEGREDTTVYTDAHSRSTTIIIGQPVSIPKDECDSNPEQHCSRGLHLGSTNFMSKNYFGKVGLVCLCNPMHVVAVPYKDGQKLRTSEYLPIGIAEYGDNGKIIPVETATFEYDYAEHTEEQLERMLSEARFESLKEHSIIPLEMRYEEFKDIVSAFSVTTDEMNKKIKNRIIKVN